MSQGAVFNLVVRDERTDRLLAASDHLRLRLDKIRAAREAAGEANAQPTYADIARSHRLFIHTAYKPYVATASEYARVKPAGDGASGIGAAGASCEFKFPCFGHFTSDMAIRVRFPAVGSPTAAAASAETPLFRYCAYPGVRLFQRVELRSDSALFDDYTPDDVLARAKFFLRPEHQEGWDRCNGQQESRKATYTANGFTGVLEYGEGPQTPKLYQEAFEMIVPLDFWFCRDAAQALVNDLVSNTQRTVTCSLAPLGLILQALVPDPESPGRLAPTPLPMAKINVTMELYVNGLYTNPEIHDVFASRTSFRLIRVHRRQTKRIQSPEGSFLLDQLKYPAEFFCAGVRARALAADFDRWWLMGVPAPRPDTARLMVPAMVWNSGLGVCQLVCREAVEASTLENPVASLGVTAHGVEMYALLPSIFYNAYLPTRYGYDSLVVSPADAAAYMINFCLHPGRFEPSGYYNLSAGREMYINYALKESAASASLDALELVVSMSAINFLVREGDGLRLRYAL